MRNQASPHKVSHRERNRNVTVDEQERVQRERHHSDTVEQGAKGRAKRTVHRDPRNFYKVFTGDFAVEGYPTAHSNGRKHTFYKRP